MMHCVANTRHIEIFNTLNMKWALRAAINGRRSIACFGLEMTINLTRLRQASLDNPRRIP